MKTDAANKNTNASRKKGFYLILFPLAALAAAISVYLYFAVQTRRPAPEDLITFQKWPAGASATIFFTDSKETRELSLTDGVVKLPPDIRERFSLPYTVRISINGLPDARTADITWSIDRDGRVYDVLLEGFQPSDRLDFLLGTIKAYVNTPFDWSGRLKAHFILLTEIDTNACVTIRRTAHEFGFCHMITGKR